MVQRILEVHNLLPVDISIIDLHRQRVTTLFIMLQSMFSDVTTTRDIAAAQTRLKITDVTNKTALNNS